MLANAGSRPRRLFECGAWSSIWRSYLLPVSQLRSHRSIELPDRRTLVAAKVWVSPYPIGVLIIHTRRSRGIPNAWRFEFKLVLVFKVQWFRLSGWRCSPLNAALYLLIKDQGNGYNQRACQHTCWR